MATIELRAFAEMQQLFKERGWSIPKTVAIPENGITGSDLIKQLDIPADNIEAMFVNGVAFGLKHAIKPGDRVAFVPQGIPSIYRVHLGFYSKENRE
ncbi:MoaD/ThiS family protein [Peptococcaceae bacterium 1198_IL3148]